MNEFASIFTQIYTREKGTSVSFKNSIFNLKIAFNVHTTITKLNDI